MGQLSAQQILRRLSADLVVEYARGLPPDERESLRGRLQADAGGELRDVGLPPLPETIEFPDAVSARKFLQSLATELRSHVLSQAASLKTALEALSGIGFESHEDLLQILADLQLLGQCGLEFALAKRAASMKAGTPVHLTHENPSSGRPLGRMVAFDATGKANPAKGTTFLPLTVKLPKP